MLWLISKTMILHVHGEKFWTRTRSKYTDLGEFETIWPYKTINKTLIGISQQCGRTSKLF